MKRAGIFILVLMALLLTACGRQQAATQMLPTATPTLAGNVPTALIPTSAPAFCVAQTGVLPPRTPPRRPAYPRLQRGLGVGDRKMPVSQSLNTAIFQCPYCAMLETCVGSTRGNLSSGCPRCLRHFPLKIHSPQCTSGGNRSRGGWQTGPIPCYCENPV